MARVGFVTGAREKYELLTNGIKKDVDGFLKELVEDKVKAEELEVFSRKNSIYHKDCGKMVIILTMQDDEWIILDFLTSTEFKDIPRDQQ